MPGDSDPLGEALALHRAGRLVEAEAAYRALLDRDAEHVDGLHLLGLVNHQLGRHDRAIEPIARAAALAPDVPAYRGSLGFALRAAGRADEAAGTLRAALVLDPGYAEALNGLASALKDRGALARAVLLFERVLRLAPDHAEAHYNLGNALQAQGRPDEALARYDRARALRPELLAIESNRLFCLTLVPGFDDAALLHEIRRWGRQVEAAFAPLPPPANDADPERRLRVGYVSSEFRQHLFLSEFLPVLRRHDHRRFEIFCYADVATPDGLTEEIRRLADHWRDQRGRSFDARAAEIRADGIDILVCLTGYLAEQRVLFARRLAPVQVAYINQVGTSGLAAMDYRITDAWVDPPDRAESGNVETLERLPGGYSTWEPPPVAPDPGPLPARANGHVTFGVFNNLAKLSRPALTLWAEILAVVPDARLLVKAPTLSDDGTRALFLDRLAACGIASERVELMGPVPRLSDSLAAMARADVAFDPFPFNGGISTREILWMGVPVVSLSGDRFVGRLGASTLTRVGLGDLVAADPAGYRDRAVALARDLDRLAALRAGLRARLAASALCAADRHTAELEAAYRAMWRRWCARAR